MSGRRAKAIRKTVIGDISQKEIKHREAGGTMILNTDHEPSYLRRVYRVTKRAFMQKGRHGV